MPEKLEHREMICDLEDKHCKECGEELVCIGKEFVRSELSIIPAQVFVVDIYRKVYKCAKCEEKNLAADIIKAEPPVPVMKKSMATPATVAYVMQQKYQLGVPLYRQEQYWKSEGVELGRNTLANWIIRSSMWFEPLWKRMQEILLNEYMIQPMKHRSECSSAMDSRLTDNRDNGYSVRDNILSIRWRCITIMLLALQR